MFFQNKQRHIEAQLTVYCEQVTTCINGLHKTFKDYCENGDRELLLENIACVSSYEGKADDIRREIEIMMYSKALFPESRGDILGLLETADKIPNQAESVVFMLKTHHLEIPERFQEQMLEMVQTCKYCVAALLDAVAKLFSEFKDATIAVSKVDKLESDVDKLEIALTEAIMTSDCEGTHKLVLCDLVQRIGGLCDRAEDAGDRVRIIVAKRGL